MEAVIESMDGVVISGRKAMRTCKRLGLACPRTIVQCDRHEAQRLRSKLVRKSLSLKKLLLWLKNRPQVHVKNDGQARAVKNHLRELGADAPQRAMLPHNLNRTVREVRRTRTPPQPPLKGHVQIEHCDFRKLKLEPASVDLIFTDPLYGKKYLPLYSDLAGFAAQFLKPDGILMAYVPQVYFNQVIRRLDEHLGFLWPCVLVNDECSLPNFHRGFFTGHRPVLVYTTAKSNRLRKVAIQKSSDYVRDTFKRSRKEKSLHAYQQPVDEAMYFIGKLTQPGDLIVDCFGGSFTTAEAVYRLGGRRFLGCDIDEKCVAMGRKRLAKVMQSMGEDNSRIA